MGRPAVLMVAASDRSGRVMRNDNARAVARAGNYFVELRPPDVIPLPEGATLMRLPGRVPVGADASSGEFVQAVRAWVSDEVTCVAEGSTQDLAVSEDSAVIEGSAVIEDAAGIDDFSVIDDVAMIEMPDAAFLADEATIGYTDRADQQTDEPYEAEVPDTFEV